MRLMSSAITAGAFAFMREPAPALEISHRQRRCLQHIGQDGGNECLVTELLVGATLAELRGEFLGDAGRVLMLGARLAAAFAAAHEQGVIHRDIKPANIFMTSRGVEAPRIPDVSEILLAEKARLPEALRGEAEVLARISKTLRGDRALAFYGTEDLTPSSFYSREDAWEAREGARTTVRLVKPFVPE